MFKPMDLFSTVLARPLRVGDDTVCLRPDAAKKLDQVGLGNHTYFVVRGMSGRAEILKYHHTEDYKDRRGRNAVQVPVERDATYQGRWSFGEGSCLEFQWTTVALTEWIDQVRPIEGG